MLSALHPLEAIRVDGTRAGDPVGSPLRAYWLQVGLGLWRVGQSPVHHRAELLRRTGGVARTAAIGDRRPENGRGVIADEATHLRLAAAFEAVADELASGVPTREDPAASVTTDEGRLGIGARPAGSHGQALSELVAQVQRHAALLEQDGAFALAASVLAGLEMAVPAVGVLDKGRLQAQRGRIARQLGDWATAEHCYREAGRLAKIARDADLQVRAAMGQGVLAAVRGNYPEARTSYRRALRLCRRHALPALASSAHQGLAVAALAAADYDTALAHAWRAFEGVEHDGEREAEMLGLLGTISLQAGQPRAALRAFEDSLERSALPRLQVATLGNAASAAAHAGDWSAARRYIRRASRAARSQQAPYERAFTYIELARSSVLLGCLWRAAVFARHAVRLGEEGGFGEVRYRAEQVLDEVRSRVGEAAADAELRRAAAADVHGVSAAGRERPRGERQIEERGQRPTPGLSRKSWRVISALERLRPVRAPAGGASAQNQG